MLFVAMSVLSFAQPNYVIERNPLSTNIVDGDFVVGPIVSTTGQRVLKIKLSDNADGTINVELRKVNESSFICDGVIIFYKDVDGIFEQVALKPYYVNSCSDLVINFTLMEDELPNYESSYYLAGIFPYGTSCLDGTICVGADGVSPTMPSEGLLGNPHIIGAWNITEPLPSGEYIKINSPVLTTSWSVGETKEIAWEDNIDQNVRIMLMKDGDYERTLITQESMGSFFWTIPTNLVSGVTYQIALVGQDGSNAYQISDNFEIKNTPEFYIHLISPISSNSLKAGEQYEITWEDNISENVKIKLYNTQGNIKMITFETESDGQFIWDVPLDLPDGNDYEIKIQSRVDADINSWSDVFNIEGFVPTNNNPCSATYLPSYTTPHYYSCINLGATHSGITIPTCGDYDISGEFGDVWYKCIVPVSGILQFNFQVIDGEPIDWAAEIYEGTCSNLTTIICDDDDNDLFVPNIEVTGRTPGEILYIRVWQNHCEFSGKLKICAIAPVLNYDLIVNNLSLLSNTIQKGKPITGYCTVSNIGTGVFGDSLLVRLLDSNGQFLTTLKSDFKLNTGSSKTLNFSTTPICDMGTYKIAVGYLEKDDYIILSEKTLNIYGILIEGINITSQGFVGESVLFSASVTPETIESTEPVTWLYIKDTKTGEADLIQMDIYISENNTFVFRKEHSFPKEGNYEITYISWYPSAEKVFEVPWYSHSGITSYLSIGISPLLINNNSIIPNKIIQDETEIDFNITLYTISGAIPEDIEVFIEFESPNEKITQLLMEEYLYYRWKLKKKMSTSGIYKYRYIVKRNGVEIASLPSIDNTKLELMILPQLLEPGVTITNKNLSSGTFDCYKFTVPKGNIIAFEVFTETTDGSFVTILLSKNNQNISYNSFNINALSVVRKKRNEAAIFVDNYQSSNINGTATDMKLTSKDNLDTYYVMIYPTKFSSFSESAVYNITLTYVYLHTPLSDGDWLLSRGYFGASHNQSDSYYAIDLYKSGTEDCGLPVLSASDGTVIVTQDDPNGIGKNVRIRHGNANSGYTTLYLHLYSINVHVNQKIKQGQVLGMLGSTGLSSGPHLHFALQRGRISLPLEPMLGDNVVYPNNGNTSFWNEKTGLGQREITGVQKINKEKYCLIDNKDASIYGDFINVQSSGFFNDYSWIAAQASNKKETAAVRWTPNITEVGNYNVYVNTGSTRSTANVIYSIYHTDGISCIELIQNYRMYNTNKTFSNWNYLGNFNFKKGINPNTGSVRINNANITKNGDMFADVMLFCKSENSPIIDSVSTINTINCPMLESSDALLLSNDISINYEDSSLKISTEVSAMDFTEGVLFVFLTPIAKSNDIITLWKEEINVTNGDNLKFDFEYSDQIPPGVYKVEVSYNIKNTNDTILIGEGKFKNQVSFVIGTTDEEQLLQISDITTFPNPVKNKLYINYKKNLNIACLKIYSLDGKLLFLDNLKKENTTKSILDISSIENGMYMLHIITTQNQCFIKRIVVIK